MYACWRAGAVVVVADAGLGLPPGSAGPARRRTRPRRRRPPGSPLRGRAGRPGHAGSPPGRSAGRAWRSTPSRSTALARRGRALLGRGTRAARRGRAGRRVPPCCSPPARPGPAKGVVYRHRQVRAQLAALRAAYGITGDDRLVAAFAPFALYGPALGIASAVPDVDVTARRADRRRAGRRRRGGRRDDGLRLARRRCATSSRPAADLDPAQRAALAGVRRVLSAGAPVPAALLHALRGVLPNAAAHTPYGMTEALPVTDISLAEIDAAGAGDGVCVGHAAARRRRRGEPAVAAGCAARRADPRARDDGRGQRRRAARQGPLRPAVGRRSGAAPASRGWHRTGDVGHLDAEGRLWIEGRLVHVITTADGAGHPRRGRAAGRGASTGSRPRPWSGSDRPGRSRWSWSWCPSRGTRPARRRAAGSPRPALTDAVRAAAGVRRGGGAGGRRAARRHPARVEDRPHAGGGVGGPGAGG